MKDIDMDRIVATITELKSNNLILTQKLKEKNKEIRALKKQIEEYKRG